MVPQNQGAPRGLLSSKRELEALNTRMHVLRSSLHLRCDGLRAGRAISAIHATKRVIEPGYYDDIYPSVYDRVVNNAQSLKLEEVSGQFSPCNSPLTSSTLT